MNRRLGFVGLMLATVTVALPTGAQGPRSAPPPVRASAPGGVVARVGQLSIGYDELDRFERQALQLYRDRNQTDVAPELLPLIRRQVLENLIRQRLLALDGRRRGVNVSDAEAEAMLRLDPVFQLDGRFNEAKFLAIRNANPEGFAKARGAAKDALAARRTGEVMDRETRPDIAVIRAELEREMTRATLEYLALRGRDLDGSGTEPSEAEVLAHYAANPERFRRPEQATIGMVLFNRPPASDSMGATDAGYRAWEQRMRGRADSAMAAIRSGARLDDLAPANGGMKSVTLLRDEEPDLWRGGPREVAAVFAASPGTLLPAPVRAASGWALVRVLSIRPSHIAPLRDVTRQIRRDLREAAGARRSDRMLEEVYGALRDSLRGPGYRVRYALADTLSFAPGEPTGADLDRFYRAHLADYASYDAARGTVAETPLATVRGEVRGRWIKERRRTMARAAAERLSETWTHGRRDAALERSMTWVRDLGVVPAAGSPDTGRAGAALAGVLASRRGQVGVSVAPIAGGFIVLDLRETLPDYQPTLDQARSLLAPILETRRDEELSVEARRLYDADPRAYRSPAMVVFSRVVIQQPLTLDVELSRDEVERHYRANLKEYSVEELARVRHILIATSGPGSRPSGPALARAESLMARLRAGDDFAQLAAEFSDDPATRLSGGDVGVFRRGMMREAFERAAFAMRVGDLVGPVRTEVGYHVLECLEYHPPIFHPLVQVYANVAFDCASKKARRVAAERADSLYRSIRSLAHLKAVIKRQNLDVLPTEHEVGRTHRFDSELLPYILKIETMKPGEIYPGVQNYEGLGPVISWVDTVLPPRPLTWEEARQGAVDRLRRERASRTLFAKRAEFDSLASAGWDFDSLAALLGGAERLTEATVASELRGMGGRALLDSLAFGRKAQPALEVGRPSEWIMFPGGFARIRVVERFAPDPDDFNRRLEQRRQLVLWRNLKTYFDRLRERYPVEILDGDLRATILLEPTES